MVNELPFDGFEEFVRKPLEQSDPESFKQITGILINSPINPGNNHFSLLIKQLTGKVFDGRNAEKHWRYILNHKADMEAKLGRRIRIQPAALDYFDSISSTNQLPSFNAGSVLASYSLHGNQEEWVKKIYTPGYHLEKLKEEMMRAKRYRHSLSAALMDVDNFKLINEKYSFKTGDEILTLLLKIVRKTIRTVDIISRYSGDSFLIILPNTNKREAIELSDRLRQNICARTKHISWLSGNNCITVTISVCQCDYNKQTTEIIKQLESVLRAGKQKGRNAVYTV